MSENPKQSTAMNIQNTPSMPSDDERAAMLAHITATGDDDNAECAAADLFREFPPLP
jgi:hypothetical protein